MTKFDVKDHVTKSIITAIEAGTVPWRKPWMGNSFEGAFPLRSTGQHYRGINILLLWCAAQESDFASAHWFTFKQAKDLGGGVRKGQKSSTVVKYGTFDKEGDNGEEKKIPYTRAYRVFNADQIDGLPAVFYAPPEEPRDLGTEADPELEAFFAKTGADIITTTEPRAYYRHDTDQIHMPPIQTFVDAGKYYGTLGHETVHWSGVDKRLGRNKRFKSNSERAMEEMTAEIGAAILGVKLGIEPDFEQNAAYVESWLAVLKDDNTAIFKAASEAQKAVDFIEGKAFKQDAEAA